jgi:hypothetical protein
MLLLLFFYWAFTCTNGRYLRLLRASFSCYFFRHVFKRNTATNPSSWCSTCYWWCSNCRRFIQRKNTQLTVLRHIRSIPVLECSFFISTSNLLSQPQKIGKTSNPFCREHLTSNLLCHLTMTSILTT